MAKLIYSAIASADGLAPATTHRFGRVAGRGAQGDNRAF
jgi:hypothetical protein